MNDRIFYLHLEIMKGFQFCSPTVRKQLYNGKLKKDFYKNIKPWREILDDMADSN